MPLDPKADSSTCIACHEDKTKGKSVHSAIAMGCTSCHEIRVNKDITRVKLMTTTPQALCLTCHADKDAAHLKELCIRRRYATASSVTILIIPTIRINY